MSIRFRFAFSLASCKTFCSSLKSLTSTVALRPSRRLNSACGHVKASVLWIKNDGNSTCVNRDNDFGECRWKVPKSLGLDDSGDAVLKDREQEKVRDEQMVRRQFGLEKEVKEDEGWTDVREIDVMLRERRRLMRGLSWRSESYLVWIDIDLRKGRFDDR